MTDATPFEVGTSQDVRQEALLHISPAVVVNVTCVPSCTGLFVLSSIVAVIRVSDTPSAGMFPETEPLLTDTELTTVSTRVMSADPIFMPLPVFAVTVTVPGIVPAV